LEVHQSLIRAVLIGSIPLIALLVRILGPRRAALCAILGGYVFLPKVFLDFIPGRIGFGKPDAIAAGLVLGIVGFDRAALGRARLRWIDLPMLAWVLYPLTGFLTESRLVPWDVAEMIYRRTTGSLVPYAAGRLYFGDDEGTRSIGVGVVLAALVLVPVCWFEALMGPEWYLNGLIYGIPYQEGLVTRAWGWRPEGFLGNGIELANWMAMGGGLAFWLAIGDRAWPSRWGPSWWPPLVLVLTVAACRGLYGYVFLGVGLAAAGLTRTLRTRWILVALALVAPVYMALRVTGTWSARNLPRLVEVVGKTESIGFRIAAEDAVMRSVLARHPALGFGVHIWNVSVVHETFTNWPDGAWLATLWEGGLVGLALALAAIHLFPAGLALARPPGRPRPWEAGSAAWGLVLGSILHMTDSLHNPAPFLPTALIAGALAGRSLSPTKNRTYHTDYRPASKPATANRLGPGLVRLALVLLVLATPEILDAAWRFWTGPAPAPAPESRPSTEPSPNNR
jgi:hypothetical protein